MNKRIINRVKEEGKCMIDTGKTVREIASKILKYHIDVRHIRGGESTRRKFFEENAN